MQNAYEEVCARQAEWNGLRLAWFGWFYYNGQRCVGWGSYRRSEAGADRDRIMKFWLTGICTSAA